jgi:hypothetical protein
MKAIQKPITYEAEQFDGHHESAIKKLLEGTDVHVLPRGNWLGLPIHFPPPPYETHGYIENGKIIRVFPSEWVVVSSTGEVRKLTPKEYDAEFYEDWEKDLAPAEEVVVLRGQVAFLAEHVARMLSDTGGWYTTDDMKTLKTIKDNDW